MTTQRIRRRADEVFSQNLAQVQFSADRVFLWLFLAQWIFAVALALTVSPLLGSSAARGANFQLQLAVFGGGALNALPVALLIWRPAWSGTRHVVAITQMLWSAMFVHLTGGRIETHFHIFVSLAFLSFYRDSWLLLTATVVVAADHLLVGFFRPESVYGIANPEWWRFLEHAGWVLFEDIVLFLAGRRVLREMRTLAAHEATLEAAMVDVEQQVWDRTEELRLMAESTKAIPFTLDLTHGRFSYIGAQGVVAWGIEESQWKEPGALEIIVPRELNHEVRQRFDECESGPFEFVTPLVHLDRPHTEVRWTGTCEWVNASKILRGLVLDITEVRRLGRELAASQKLESVGRLAAGIAHEINTPIQFVSDNVQFVRTSMIDITAVIGAYRALQHAAQSGGDVAAAARLAGDAETAADLDYILQNAPAALDSTIEGLERIATIVRSMKEFAHPDQAEKQSADLNQAIRSTIVVAHNEYKYIAELDIQLEELPPVQCYLGEINQVVLNLLVNASHAIADVVKDTGELGKLTVRSRVVGGEIEISIADTGSGIPETARGKIFDPFFTTKEVGKGTGQGLAIARSVIVNKHGGTLRFETECGKGTTFFIRLPINGSDETPDLTRIAA